MRFKRKLIIWKRTTTKVKITIWFVRLTLLASPPNLLSAFRNKRQIRVGFFFTSTGVFQLRVSRTDGSTCGFIMRSRKTAGDSCESWPAETEGAGPAGCGMVKTLNGNYRFFLCAFCVVARCYSFISSILSYHFLQISHSCIFKILSLDENCLYQ